MLAKVLRGATTMGGLLLLSSRALADWTTRSAVNMRPGATDMSEQIQDLHMLIFWVCTVIGLLVFGLILWSVIHHRRSKNPTPASFHEHLGLEITWTVIPFIILVLMAWPATRVLLSLDDSSNSALTIKVTGYQWYWHYEYLTYEDDMDVGVQFFSKLATPSELYERPVLQGGLFPRGTARDRAGNSFTPLTADNAETRNYLLEVDNRLVLPAGQKVRFLVTSDDVIHSFWVPDFGFKKDAIPGFVNEIWTEIPEGREGIYRGQCAELCGRYHAFMPIEVEVVPRATFTSWLEEKRTAMAEGPDLTPFPSLAAARQAGEAVFNQHCAVCHGTEGQGGIGPSFQGSDLMTNSARVEENKSILLNGRAAMPSFKAQLSPRDIAAVIRYQRNAFGNDTGDLVQPEHIGN